jgi:acyl-CoA reductase-like NAD-dependent aldehyde dehydrogenase
VINIVTGPGRVVGDAMTRHKDVAKIAFTGSTPVGNQIAKAAADLVVPTTLELGGKSANIVFPDAPMEKALEGAALAILYGQGQVCNAGSRLLLHEDIYDEFLEKLKVIFQKVKIGNPMDEDTRMGTLINEKQLNNALDYIKIGVDEGARLYCGGNQLTDGIYKNGFYLQPTILSDVANDMRVAQEEIFGPVLVVIKYKDEKDAIRIANDSQFGLAGACWTKDINRALRVSKAIESGTVWINEFHLVPSHSPFGGYKKSGYGREAHKLALESYSQIKNIYISLTEETSGWYDND